MPLRAVPLTAPLAQPKSRTDRRTSSAQLRSQEPGSGNREDSNSPLLGSSTSYAPSARRRLGYSTPFRVRNGQLSGNVTDRELASQRTLARSLHVIWHSRNALSRRDLDFRVRAYRSTAATNKDSLLFPSPIGRLEVAGEPMYKRFERSRPGAL